MGVIRWYLKASGARITEEVKVEKREEDARPEPHGKTGGASRGSMEGRGEQREEIKEEA